MGGLSVRRPAAWLHCGSEECGRRARTLHLHPKQWPPFFVCRGCAGIRYPSKSRPRHLRQLDKAIAIRVRLGGEPDIDAPFPRKPAGKHWSTYERDLREYLESEAEYREAVRDRPLTRLGIPPEDLLAQRLRTVRDTLRDKLGQ